MIDPENGEQITNHENSANPAFAVLSNTAASYLALGGRWQYLAVAGDPTDYALFAYQVPLGYRLHISGISITVVVRGAAVVTPTILDWSLGLHSTDVSLASPSLRRFPIGIRAFTAGAGIGQAPAEMVRRYQPVLISGPGEYVHIIMQQPNGAATVGLHFRGDVVINGLFRPV